VAAITVPEGPIAEMPGWLVTLIQRDRKLRIPSRPSKPAGPGASDPYAAKALENECRRVREAPDGTRNDTLNRAAFSLGQLVAGGVLEQGLVEQELLAAAEACGLLQDDGSRSCEATIQSGLAAGLNQPRCTPDRHDEDTTVRASVEAGPARPEIRIGSNVAEIVDKVEQAILDNQPGEAFQKCGLLVRVLRGATQREKVRRASDAPVIGALPPGRLLEIMASAARWKRFSRQRYDWEPAIPPERFVKVLQDRGTWTFPHLEAVSEAPVLRPDGTIVETPGLDETTGTLYLPNANYPKVPERPTREQASQAVADLFRPFMDFPFRELSDASVLLSGILSILARPTIRGPVPLHVIRKNTPGAGGTLAVDALSVICTGRPASRMTLSPEAAEMRKLVLTVAVEGDPLVLLDNLEGAIGSSVLSAMLTAGFVQDRLLGSNRTVKAPMRGVWFATGNGLTFRRDLGRRVLLCDLWTRLEHPEDRRDFRHPDLLDYLAQERPRLVIAALTILRAHAVAGRPEHAKPRKGGFEGWDAIVRSALVWARADDPVETVERIRAEADTDLDALRGALAEWKEVFGGPVTAAEAVEAARDNTELRGSLAELCRCPSDKLDSRRLGYALRQHVGRMLDGHCFMRSGVNRTKTGRWTVGTIQGAGDAGDPGDTP